MQKIIKKTKRHLIISQATGNNLKGIAKRSSRLLSLSLIVFAGSFYGKHKHHLAIYFDSLDSENLIYLD